MICNDDQQPLPQAGLIASNRHRSPAVIVASDQMMNMEGSAAGANNLDRYIHALRRNWFWCLLLGGVLGGGVGAAIYSLVPNRFTAVAELRAYSRPDRLIDAGPDAADREIRNVHQQRQAVAAIAHPFLTPP